MADKVKRTRIKLTPIQEIERSAGSNPTEFQSAVISILKKLDERISHIEESVGILDKETKSLKDGVNEVLRIVENNY